jgi:hypothetical protein
MTARIDHITYNVTLCGKFYEVCEKMNVNNLFMSSSTGVFTACPGACMENCKFLTTRVCVEGKDVCTELCDWKTDPGATMIYVFVILLGVFVVFYFIVCCCKLMEFLITYPIKLERYRLVNQSRQK